MKENNYYKLNAARCKICDTVVVATNNDEKTSCQCGNLIVAGNLSTGGLIRYIKQIDDYHEQYEELSQYNTGHSVSEASPIIKPQSALEEIRYGKCFIQYHIHSPERLWKNLDEYGQSLAVVETIVGEDYMYDTTVRFRFWPNKGLTFYASGDISPKSISFFEYIMKEIVQPFIAAGQTRLALYKILIDHDFQDRTGMKTDEWRI